MSAKLSTHPQLKVWIPATGVGNKKKVRITVRTATSQCFLEKSTKKVNSERGQFKPVTHNAEKLSESREIIIASLNFGS